MQAASARWHHHANLAAKLLGRFLLPVRAHRSPRCGVTCSGYSGWLFQPFDRSRAQPHSRCSRCCCWDCRCWRHSRSTSRWWTKRTTRRCGRHINRKRPVPYAPYSVSDAGFGLVILLARFHALSKSASLLISASAGPNLSALMLGISFSISRSN